MSKYFDPWKTYDATAEEKQAVLERSKMREALKAEFQKKFSDPYRPTTGYIFDPAIQRNYSSRFTVNEHFKPSKYVVMSLCIILVPYFIGRHFFMKTRDIKEKQIRSGKNSYKDRQFDHMLNP